MAVRILERAFSAGELTPELFCRFDIAKVLEGLALCRNFITLPHGPAINRAGTEFVREVKNSSLATRLIPFSYNNTQTFAIELGAGYFRFHTNAATVLNAAGTAPYEITNPYAAADLFDIHYVQSADVMTLVHPNYPPLELRRYGATDWRTVTPSFNAPTNIPTGVTAVATGSGSTSYNYVVTSVAPSTLEESVVSAAATCSNDLTIAGNKNTISWTAPTGAAPVRYYVYRLSNGIYGYIGQASGTSFEDKNVAPDISTPPPISDTVFASAGNYPQAVTYFEQRRVFGGTLNQPQNLWMTRSGTESNMAYTIPSRDDNRIAIRIAAREASAIRHIIPVSSLILLTASCEWRVSSINSDAITPTSINVRPQSYIGANNVQPIVVGNSILFASSRGGHMREMSYTYQASGYITTDVSIMAPHLFEYKTINDMAYCRGPNSILWAVNSEGKLLGLTYVQEQQVAAWHQHMTGINDKFESVCTISENNEDMVYVIVKRTINGAQKRYVERLHTRYFATPADAFFVDCGVTYNASPATTISGLTWLEGMAVNILADGAVIPQQVVTGGTITLPIAASKVQIGLPIVADLQTLPIAASMDNAYGQGRPKNVNKVFMRTYRSSGMYAGPTFDKLRPYRHRTTELYGRPPNLVSDEIEIVLDQLWGTSGQVCVRQTDPLPLDLVGMTLELAVGGG